jgi:hypothetical protein
MSNETKALELAKELTFVKHTADWQTCDNASSELRRQHAENEANERNLGILSDELSKCEKHAKDLQTECTALRVNEENLTAQVESLRAQLEQKSERIAHLEATASSNYGRGHADAHQMTARAKDIGVEQDERVFSRIAAMKASQQAPVAQGEPVAWKHDCAALLQNDVELWVARCPHCGKPTNTAQQQASEPMTPEQIEAGAVYAGYNAYKFTAFHDGVRFAERHHQIKGKQ